MLLHTILPLSEALVQSVGKLTGTVNMQSAISTLPN